MTKSLQWFRMWVDAVDDEKLRLLAFEDRWHFVALLCLKAGGTMDSNAPQFEKRIALKLGLQLRELEEVKRRLIEVGLIDDNYQPLKWDKRQFLEDKVKGAYVYFIGKKNGDVVKIGYSKNPWARILDINSEHKKKFEVLATVRTKSNSEILVHDLLKPFRKEYEWFNRVPCIDSAIAECISGNVKTEDELLSFLRSQLRSIDVATTIRAEQSRADTDSKSPTGVGEDPDRRGTAKRLWPRVLAAIQVADLRQAFPPDSQVGRAVNQLGGWKALGLKHRDLRGQTEQAFLNAYADLKPEVVQ